MDNITHSLTGLALARAGLNRLCPHGTALAIVSANIPDTDVAALWGGPLHYFEAHRGYTHSLLMLPVMAALSVLVVAAIFRQGLPWTRAFLLCCIGVASHLLLDWTNSYGIRLLLPFSSAWFHADLNGLYDGIILAVLAFAALWPLLNSLVSSEIGSRSSGGRAMAVFAVAFFVLFDCGRAVMHARAIGKMETRLYDDMPPLTTAALPDNFNPLQWRGVVETTRSFQLMQVPAFGQFDVTDAQIFFKPSLRYGREVVERTEPFHFLAYFARFPIWTEQPVLTDKGAATRVELTDLRFGVPGAGSFHAIAIENERGQVTGSWFAFGSGAKIGLENRGQPGAAAEYGRDE